MKRFITMCMSLLMIAATTIAQPKAVEQKPVKKGQTEPVFCIRKSVQAEPIGYYYLVLSDSNNDGWDGSGKMRLTDGDYIEEFSLSYGASPKLVKVPYYGNTITYTWIQGSYTNEVGIQIMASNGTNLFSRPFYSSTLSGGDVLYTSTESPIITSSNPQSAQDLQATINTNAEVVLSWTAASGIDSYYLYVLDKDGNNTDKQSIDQSATSSTASINKNGDYEFCLAGINSGTYCGLAILNKTINLPTIESADISVLLPSDGNFDASNGLWLQWYVTGEETAIKTVAMTKSGNRYNATIAPDAVSYGFFVTNTAGPNNATCRSYSIDNLRDATYCCELAYKEEYQYYYTIVPNDCALTDHDFRPYDMKTEVDKATVTFSFKVHSEITDARVWYIDEYGYDQYLGNAEYNTEKERWVYTHTFYQQAQDITYPAWFVEVYNGTSFSNYGIIAGEFTIPQGDYIPYITVKDEGNDKYTISWSTKLTPDHYVIALYNSTNAEYVVEGASVTENKYEITLAADCDYSILVNCYDESNDYLNGNQISFSTKKTEATPITLHFKLPRSSSFRSNAGYALKWQYEGFEPTITPLVKENETWYKADITITKSEDQVRMQILNGNTEETATMQTKSATTFDRFYKIDNNDYSYSLNAIDPTLYPFDYEPYNLQAISGQGEVTFRWEIDNEPEYIYLSYRQKGTSGWQENYFEGYRTFYQITLGNDKTTTYEWLLTTYNLGYHDQVNGEDVVVQPSKFIPTNLKATANDDGTYNISWDAPDAEDVNFDIEIYYSNGDFFDSYWASNGTRSITTSAFYATGTFTYSVVAYKNGKNCGEASDTFTVNAKEARDITIRLLMHPDNNINVSSGVYIGIYNVNTNSYTPQALTADEKPYWYSCTINNVTAPALRIQLPNSYTRTLSESSCIEVGYTYYGKVNCEAVAHDYRPINLTATAGEGRVDFSWSAKDKSNNYQLQYTTDDWNTTSAIYNITEQQYCFPVADINDGKTLKWKVKSTGYSSSRQETAYTTAEDAVILKKGTTSVSNLAVTSEDNKTFNFTWDTNNASAHYLVRIACKYNGVCKETVVTTNAFTYTAVRSASYEWYVTPLTTDDKVTGEMVEGPDFAAEGITSPTVTNLVGSVNGMTINFTWQTNADAVGAYLVNMEGDNYEMLLDLEPLTGNSFQYTVAKEGLYVMELLPAVEYASGKYTMLQPEGPDDYAITCVTVFSGKTYHLSLSTTEGGWLEPDFSGDYAENFTLEIYAMSLEGYRFERWSDGVTSSYRTITMTSDITLKAFFSKMAQYNLHVAATEGGTVNEEKEINKIVYEDSYISLEAIADPGYGFLQWSDGDTDSYRYFSSFNSDIDLTAQFGKLYTVSIAAEANGNVNNTVNGTYVAGSTLVITATPDDGYRFSQWSDGDKNASRQITVNDNITLTASFESAGSTPQHLLYVRVIGNGNVNGENGIYQYYYEGDQLQLVAKPNEENYYVFNQWSDGVTDAIRNITIGEEDIQLTALFSTRTYTLTLTAGNGGKVNSEINGKYRKNDYAYLVATPDNGYRFLQWSDGNTMAERTIRFTNKDITLNAVFVKNATEYTLTVKINNNAAGTVSVSRNSGSLIEYNAPIDIEEGTQVRLVATANQGYRFIRWDDGTTDADRTFTMNSNKNITAIFESALGIDNMSGNNITVSVSDQNIRYTIENGTASEVFLFDVTGSLVSKQHNTNSGEFAAPVKGIYILRADDNYRKVIVK